MAKVIPVTFKGIVSSFLNAPEYALLSKMACQLWTRLTLFAQVVLKMAANQKNTLMYLWLFSHAACLLGFIGSFFVPYAYDVAVIGCNVTYLMAVHRHLAFLLREERGSLKLRAPILDLLRGENTVLLAAAVLMANTDPSAVKILPFATYATMNLVSFLFLDVLPTSPFTKTSMPFLRYLETTMLSHVCYWDFVVMAAYCYEWIMGRGSFCWLMFYIVTWIVKLEISELSRKALHYLINSCKAFAGILGVSVVVRRIESVQIALSILLPTKESFVAGAVPNLTLSPKDRVESLMFDSFSIINDVSK